MSVYNPELAAEVAVDQLTEESEVESTSSVEGDEQAMWVRPCRRPHYRTSCPGRGYGVRGPEGFHPCRNPSTWMAPPAIMAPAAELNTS